MIDSISPPAEFAGWLACLGFTLWIVNLGWKVIRLGRGCQTDSSHELLGRSVTELDRRVSNLEEWQKRLTEKLETDKLAIMGAGDDRAKRLHARINKLLAAHFLMAGQLGVVLDDRRLETKLREIENDPDL